MAKRKKSPEKPASKKGRKPILEIAAVASAITKHDGNISRVASLFNVARASVQEFISKNPTLQAVLSDARESIGDMAESSLHRAVKAGEAWAVCFLLKTQFKKRGYVEKQQIEHSDATPTEVEEELLASRKAATDATAS